MATNRKSVDIEKKIKDFTAAIVLFIGLVAYPWIVGVRTLYNADYAFTEFNLNPVLAWLDVGLFILLGYLIYKQKQGRNYVLVDKPKAPKVRIMEDQGPKTQNVYYEDEREGTNITFFDVDIKAKLKEYKDNAFKWTYDQFEEEYNTFGSVEALRLDLNNKMRPWKRNPHLPKNLSLKQIEERARAKVDQEKAAAGAASS